jgi:nucleotidyltransferase/DNA polymerase involved in DNA repair
MCSVEELDQPALKDKPMAVGGMGMICTANYLARTFGVRSAMPGFIAKKLCPQVRWACVHYCNNSLQLLPWGVEVTNVCVTDTIPHC